MEGMSGKPGNAVLERARGPDYRPPKEAQKPTLVERLLRSTKSPMEAIWGEYKKQRTGDHVEGMAAALKTVLTRDRYSRELREQVLGMKPSIETDLMFTSAMLVFERDGLTAGNAAGRMAQDMLDRGLASEATMAVMLSDDSVRGLFADNKKAEKAAGLMATMCCRLAHTAESIVERVTDTMDGFMRRGTPAQKDAAEAFLKRMEARVVEMPAVA